MRLRLVTFSIVLALAAPTVAHARKKVALGGVSGAGARRVETALTEVLAAGQHEVVGSRDVARARKKLRAPRKDDATWALVARYLGADAIVEGKVRRGEPTVTVRAAADGKATATIAVACPRGRLAPAARDELAARLLPAIEPPPPPPPPAVAPVAASDDDAGAPAVRAARAARRPGDGPAGAVDVELGLSVAARRLSFNYDPTLADADRPTGFDGSPVGAAYLAGEAYPLALAGRADGALARVGVALAYERALSLHTAPPGGGMEYPTTQSRLGLGLRFRQPLGRGRELTLGAGWNRLAFVVDSGADTLRLPDVAYGYVDAGAAVRWPLAGRLALRADARYLHVLSTGEMGAPSRYGGGAVRGVDVDAAVEVGLRGKVSLRLGARLVRMGWAFDGSGAMTDPDGDATTDVGGAIDQFASGYATAAYRW